MTHERPDVSQPEPCTGPFNGIGAQSAEPGEPADAPARGAVYRPSPSSLLEAELLASGADLPDTSEGTGENR